MEKHHLLSRLSSVPLRALIVISLAAAVIVFHGGGDSALSKDSIPGHPVTARHHKPAMSASGRRGPKRQHTTLALNYALPRRISTPPMERRIKRPTLPPPDFTRGNRHGTRISITFDGGMGAREATKILDILKKRKIKTTIFLSGNFIRDYPRITRRIVADGHEVGNHTTTHPHLTQLEINGTQKTLPHVTKAFLLEELNIAEKRFFETTGRHMAPLWRAPYGEVNSELRAWAFSAGYLHVGWTYDARSRKSLDSLDWVSDRTSRLYHGAAAIEKKILDFDSKCGGLGGGIILMHLDTDRTDDRASSILGDLLDNILERGYSPVKVSELMSDKRLLREARLKKERFYSALRLRQRTAPRPRPVTRVQAMAEER